MNQNYTSSQLLKICTSYEKRNYTAIGVNLEEDLNDTFENIRDNNFSFNFEKIGKYSRLLNLTENLVLRKLDENISRIYQEKQANRRLIIKQIITLLGETSPFWILKTDIKSFYESIDRKYLFQKLKDDSMLSYHSQFLIERIEEYLNKESIVGLPRGINISSTLSEICLRKFDLEIKQHKSVYYYARFVDDILIFCNSKEVAKALEENMNRILPKGLRKNKAKTSIFDGSIIPFEKPLIYLGYKFWITKPEGKKKVNISIADKKVQKIKTKIVKSIFNYIKTSDFELLVKRIKFLSGNYSVRNNEKTNDLLAGIYYNYPSINQIGVLNELNCFYHKLINASNGGVGTKVQSSLNPFQLRRLQKFSFMSGFKKKMVKRFTKEELKNITNCWK